MTIQITNTLSGKKETFTPITAGKVKMYVCGPTVYNFLHIGNARVNVFYDVVERFFKFSGYEVLRVVNITDIEDKIMHKAFEENVTSQEISERYTQEYLKDMQLLNINPAEIMPKVSDHLKEIIQMIEGLIKNGSAYITDDGEVLFSVRKFVEYGKLSKKKIDDLIAGARVQPDEKKKDPLDFSLWKPQKNEKEPFWESPWGKGRPGWHIECSAMATKYLGETFDLHGGGMDLIHPHHENEIAQSEAYSKKPYVNYWMHSNMLTFNAEKMSKSLGNIMLIREFVEKYSAEVLRYFLLSAHYRSTIDYSETHINEMQSALHRFYSTLNKCEEVAKLSAEPTPHSHDENKISEFSAQFKKNWIEAMEDDFNTAKVLGQIFEYVRLLNGYLDKKSFKASAYSVKASKEFIKNMKALSQVLNILGEPALEFLKLQKSLFLKNHGLFENEILNLIDQRKIARTNKDFNASDQIRDELLKKGIVLKDRGDSTEWDCVFISQ